MAKFDAAEVSALLAIPALVTNNAPQMSAILAEAMARLHAINSGLAEEKARQPRSPHEYPGMPTHMQPVPSQPIEAPKSEAAKDAPEPDQGPAHVDEGTSQKVKEVRQPGPPAYTGDPGAPVPNPKDYEEEHRRRTHTQHGPTGSTGAVGPRAVPAQTFDRPEKVEVVPNDSPMGSRHNSNDYDNNDAPRRV